MLKQAEITKDPAYPVSKDNEQVVQPEAVQQVQEVSPPNSHEHVEASAGNDKMIKICESGIYRKYFKMLKVGIPLPAVKQKMSSEGLDASLLENPELLIEKSDEDNEEQ